MSKSPHIICVDGINFNIMPSYKLIWFSLNRDCNDNKLTIYVDEIKNGSILESMDSTRLIKYQKELNDHLPLYKKAVEKLEKILSLM